MTAQTSATVDARLDELGRRRRTWIAIGAAVVAGIVVLGISIGFFVAGLRLRDSRSSCISGGLSEFAQGIAKTLDKQIGNERNVPLDQVHHAARILKGCGS